jgi:hypothetical protein
MLEPDLSGGGGRSRAMGIREKVARSIRERGAARTAKLLDLALETTLRLGVPDAPVRKGTLAQAREREHLLDVEAVHVA